MSLGEKKLYKFGDYCLDTQQGLLFCNDDVLPLAPKVLDTLLALVESEGRILGKDELLQKVWPDTFVEEGSLAQNVSVLRKTLSAGTDGHTYIQTVPKRGYRFVARVTVAKPTGSAGFPPIEPPPVEPPIKPVDQPRAASLFRRQYLVFAAFVVLLSGALYLWQQGSSHPLTDQDVLVLADFANSTGDPIFDGTLRDALAFQLEQSPFLKVLDDDLMRQDLQLMRHLAQERITNEIAHDICMREAEKAILGGSITSLGRSYAIELKATNCHTGATLARQEGVASDKEHVLAVLAKAAQGMRAKLGESLTSIEKLSAPELQVTTGSLEAFQSFTTGQQLFMEGRFASAIPFLEQATRLDPNLAMAYKFLSSAVLNTGAGDPQVIQNYDDKAYALRDRVSAYERFWIGQPGYLKVRSDEAQKNLELWARTYPRDPAPVEFAELGNAQRGEFEEALRLAQQAYQMAPRRQLYAAGLMSDYIHLDRFAEAKAVAEKHFAGGFDSSQVHQLVLRVAWMEGDEEGAEKQIRWYTGNPEEYRGIEDQAAHARMLGQLRRSRKFLEQAAELARGRALPDVAARLVAPDANGDALLGSCTSARKTRPAFVTLGNNLAILAFCGDEAMMQRAEKRIEEISRWRGGDPLWTEAQLPQVRAAMEIWHGHPGNAIDLLRSVARYERAFPFAVYLRGLAFLRLKQGVEAAAEFQKIVDHRGANWGPGYPLAYLGLARGATLSGDVARARNAYESFFSLWKDADPDIAILMQARKESSELSN
jgi:DNA-binding winged helix-turn-helix (wHTH) protein/tetratricopeptide (TPR) repeat protein